MNMYFDSSITIFRLYRYFSLPHDVKFVIFRLELDKLKIKNWIFNFYLLNKDFSVTTLFIELKFSVRVLKVPPEGGVSLFFFFLFI